MLVRNTSNEVRDCLHLARGDLLAMKANYTAAVLEGLARLLPHTLDWPKDASARKAL